MLNSTVSKLRCPGCAGKLRLSAPAALPGTIAEIAHGELICERCSGQYPILAGVAILVEDVHAYIVEHVQGISQSVPDSEIPSAYRADYLEAKDEIEIGHIEEGLEAERVIALYLANHYLHASPPGDAGEWWKPKVGSASPLIDTLIREHWDKGPLAAITSWVNELSRNNPDRDVVELGCGVGGLSKTLQGKIRSYLGIDSSFASIALGRHLALGAPYPKKIAVPNDLLEGQVTREVRIERPREPDGSVDLVVGDIEQVPVAGESFDIALALNALDMMPDPRVVPEAQRALLKPDGLAIQSCPYIWHEVVAAQLRDLLPNSVKDSAAAAEWLYEQSGFRVEKKIDQLPWLFFKHVRQLEIYSVQLFVARKTGAKDDPKA